MLKLSSFNRCFWKVANRDADGPTTSQTLIAGFNPRTIRQHHPKLPAHFHRDQVNRTTAVTTFCQTVEANYGAFRQRPERLANRQVSLERTPVDSGKQTVT